MIKVTSLINLLKKNKSDFFTGVPDSVLKELSFSLQNIEKKKTCYRYKRRFSYFSWHRSLPFN